MPRKRRTSPSADTAIDMAAVPMAQERRRPARLDLRPPRRRIVMSTATGVVAASTMTTSPAARPLPSPRRRARRRTAVRRADGPRRARASDAQNPGGSARCTRAAWPTTSVTVRAVPRYSRLQVEHLLNAVDTVDEREAQHPPQGAGEGDEQELLATRVEPRDRQRSARPGRRSGWRRRFPSRGVAPTPRAAVEDRRRRATPSRPESASPLRPAPARRRARPTERGRSRALVLRERALVRRPLATQRQPRPAGIAAQRLGTDLSPGNGRLSRSRSSTSWPSKMRSRCASAWVSTSSSTVPAADQLGASFQQGDRIAPDADVAIDEQRGTPGPLAGKVLEHGAAQHRQPVLLGDPDRGGRDVDAEGQVTGHDRGVHETARPASDVDDRSARLTEHGDVALIGADRGTCSTSSRRGLDRTALGHIAQVQRAARIAQSPLVGRAVPGTEESGGGERDGRRHIPTLRIAAG